jgi:tripartite-type tricarboxylate transporter receptor subunit TctC
MVRFSKVLALGATLLTPGVSLAQDAKTIRLIVPFAAGGPADALARAVGPGMSTALGQSVVIDNRGGAGGVLGVDAVAKAAPDGTTIGLGGFGAMTVLPFIRPAPYDVLRDLAPITLVGRNSGVLVTHPKRGFKTVADLVAFAKANPKKVNFASAGTGTSIHLSGELLALASGIQLVHVPYAKGAAPAITDLLGGHVDMMLPDISGVLEHIRSGALVALAVTGEKRSPQLPNVPTMVEAGYPKVVSETWFGLIAPVKTPAATLAALHGAAMTALKSPDVIKQIELQGSVATFTTQAEFRAFIVAEQAKWKPVVEAAGLKQ